MRSVAGHMAAIEAMAKHQVPYEHLLDQAKALADTAPVLIDIFPADSKPSDDPKGQGKVVRDVKTLGMSCGGCHREYRKEMRKH